MIGLPRNEIIYSTVGNITQCERPGMVV